MSSKRLIELFLSQLILYTAVFLWDQHVGYLLSIIIGTLSLVLLVISFILEWVEPSRVPRWYFQVMWLSFLAPFIMAGFFAAIDQYQW